MFRKFRERYHTIRRIREAINTYPDGICFAATGGRPILANHKINDVCYRLTGHTITNADVMWDELNSCKIDTIPTENSKTSTADIEQILCRLPDGNVWQFQRRRLAIDYVQVTQYEASDITELYYCRDKLMKKNAQVVQLHDRQRALLQNIIQNNVNKELLIAKLRIHDRFGRLLVMTENTLMGDDSENERSALFSAWGNVIADMENASIRQSRLTPSPENELRQIANMIGCQVEFVGEQPTERKATLLFYAAIREALTNAVRHADANKLIVQIKPKDNHYLVRIMDNGKTEVISIREGGGLSDLRRRLEQDGATMDIETGQGVIMALKIPKE